MIIEKYTKDVAYPSADYIFDKPEEFFKIVDFLYPKLEGMWTVIIVDPEIDIVRKIKSLNIHKDLADIILYVKQDVLKKYYIEYPHEMGNEKSGHDRMIDTIVNLNINIANNAAKELYNRCRGDISRIKEALLAMKLLVDDDEMLSLKEVNAVVDKDTTIFARDVILNILLKSNKHIPLRGNFLSKYKVNDIRKTTDAYIQVLGRDYAFYSLRKYVKKLFENKLKYLENKEVKDAKVMELLDVYTLLHAYLCFSLSNKNQLEVVLDELERRNISNDSDFKNTILRGESKYISVK